MVVTNTTESRTGDDELSIIDCRSGSWWVSDPGERVALNAAYLARLNAQAAAQDDQDAPTQNVRPVAPREPKSDAPAPKTVHTGRREAAASAWSDRMGMPTHRRDRPSEQLGARNERRKRQLARERDAQPAARDEVSG